MTTTDINELAARLSEAFAESPGPKGFAELFGQLIRLLASGKPVSPDRIATAIDKPREEVADLLLKLPNVELDEDGNVVGMGLTLRPTPHRFEVEGRTLFTWCALDALMFPGVIGKRVRILSPCPVSGTLVRVQVAPDKVEDVDPPAAVVSLVLPESVADVRKTFCNDVHFFSSAESASEWLAKRPGAVIVPVADAYRLGQMLAQHV
jgi:alkylmercury lyase